MIYYPFHVGDYTAHTAHLDPIEDLAYRRMLDLYYLRESALPKEPAEVARLVRLRQNVAEVEAVLSEFFLLTEGGWVSARCDEEIMRMQDKQAKAKASAEASVAARMSKAPKVAQADTSSVVERPLNERSTSAERTLNERQTDVELPTPTPTPTPVKEGEPRKRSTPAASRPEDVAEPVWDDFQRLRREKRAPLTDTALLGVRREAEKAGVPLETAIAYCCEVGWQGFNAGWYAERTATATSRSAAAAETPYQRSMRERMQEVAPAIARKAPGAAPAQTAVEFFSTVKNAHVIDDVPALRIGSHA